jgi:hypothetical protein
VWAVERLTDWLLLLLLLCVMSFHVMFCSTCCPQLTFSKEYTAAVEAKQVAQQEAERAKFIVSLCWRLAGWCFWGLCGLRGFGVYGREGVSCSAVSKCS